MTTYIDPTWVGTGPTDPFRDQSAAGIHPATMRQLAQAVDDACQAAVDAVPGGGGGLPETPLALVHGGTGSTSASAARTALGLPGYTVLPRGAYSNATPYNPGDVVVLAGANYLLTGNAQVTGTDPPSAPWFLLAPASGGGGGAPTGAAGGKLSGTYPNPGLAAGGVGTTELAAGAVTQAKIGGTLSPATITGTAVITTDGRLSDQRVPADASVTNAKIATGALTPGKFASMNTGVIGNGAPVSGVPTLLTPDDLASMLDQHLSGDQIGVSTAGGLAGPSVQTALQSLYDSMVIALDPTLE